MVNFFAHAQLQHCSFALGCKSRGRLTRGDDRSLCNLVKAYGVFARLRLKLSQTHVYVRRLLSYSFFVVLCACLSVCAPVCASGPRMDVLNRNLTSTTSSPPILRLGSALPPLFVNWLMETGMYSCIHVFMFAKQFLPQSNLMYYNYTHFLYFYFWCLLASFIELYTS